MRKFFGLTYFTHGRTLNVPGTVLFKSPVVLPILVTTKKCCLGGSSDVFRKPVLKVNNLNSRLKINERQELGKKCVRVHPTEPIEFTR